MSATDPLIGRKLGDYLIEGIQGTGGMARVYRGYDDKLDRYAAVKVIEPQLIASAEEDEYRERFLREARAIARLSHARIVGIYQFGQIDNLYYIAMEYIDGRNLREILKGYAKQDKFMPLPDAVSVLKDIASALDYAHRQSIIHRDIKPSNIIVNTEGQAILTDFGLALNAIEGTIGNTFGSVHYIAPEQAISSAQAVPASDQYSLGIITYEMFTGRVPFDDNSAMSIALKHISDPPPPLRDVNPDIPPEVEQVVMRALDKDVHKRYNLCIEFVQALETAFTIADEKPTSVSSRGNAKAPAAGVATTPVEVMAEDAPTVKDTSSRPVSIMKKTPPDDSKPSAAAIPETRQASNGRAGWLVAAVLLIILIIGGILLLPSLLQTPADTTGTQTVEALAQVALNQTASAEALIAQAVEGTANARATQTELAQTAATIAVTETNMPVATAEVVNPTTTPTVSDAATAIATEEATLSPTDTPTEVSPPTATATATETPAPVVTSSQTPSPTATEIPPTATPTVNPTPGLTMLDGNDGQLLLAYTADSLVVFNRDTTMAVPYVNLQFFLFEPNNAGEFQQTKSYAVIQHISDTRGLASRRCFQVWSSAFSVLPDDIPPADICQSRTAFAATVNTAWTSEKPNAYFEVRWGRTRVLTTCPVATADMPEPLRCVVDIE